MVRKKDQPVNMRQAWTCLSDHAQWNAIQQGCQDAADLAARVRELLPAPVSRLVTGAHLRETTLVVGIETPAAAARLRLEASRLRQGLGQRGWKIVEIRVRVQPGASTFNVSPPPRAYPEHATIAEIHDVGCRVENEKIQRAMLRLANNLSRKRHAM